MDSPAIIRLCRYIVNQNHRSSNPGARGATAPVKDRDTLIEQSVTQIKHRVVKEVVYDEFMKQIRTVRHSFNTTHMENYRVQLALFPNEK